MAAGISRFKRVVGDGLRSRTGQRRATEMAIAVTAVGRMLDLERPEYVRIVWALLHGSAAWAGWGR